MILNKNPAVARTRKFYRWNKISGLKERWGWGEILKLKMPLMT